MNFSKFNVQLWMIQNSVFKNKKNYLNHSKTFWSIQNSVFKIKKMYLNYSKYYFSFMKTQSLIFFIFPEFHFVIKIKCQQIEWIHQNLIECYYFVLDCMFLSCVSLQITLISLPLMFMLTIRDVNIKKPSTSCAFYCTTSISLMFWCIKEIPL